MESNRKIAADLIRRVIEGEFAPFEVLELWPQDPNDFLLGIGEMCLETCVDKWSNEKEMNESKEHLKEALDSLDETE